jgi:ribonuclease HII
LTTIGHFFSEAYRLRLMRSLEEHLHGAGYQAIAGVDEAGRGCLAGPVVAAAVVVDGSRLVPGVDDSKELSPDQRERLADAIRQAHPIHAHAAVAADTIDRINILEATRLAMAQALAALRPAPRIALIDAVPLRGVGLRTLSVVRGDSLCYAIACASILAKVERDRLMVTHDGAYPVYGFAAHKGYGSADHRQALATYGPCALHRLTFRSVLPRREEPAPALASGERSATARPRRGRWP